MTLHLQLVVILLLTFASTYLLVRYGWAMFQRFEEQAEVSLDRVLNHQLLLDMSPRVVFCVVLGAAFMLGVLGAAVSGSWIGFVLGAGVAAGLPFLLIRHFEQKRKARLEAQLVDGITTMSSGVRAGLNLIQSFELLHTNTIGPIKQEFGQLLREYQMGVDLNQAMRNSANRIGLRNYRLLFTAVEMHRLRGGDAGQSLERIAESIREIQRLEGKLDALTAQGRAQARYIALAVGVLVMIAYMIDPDGVSLLFSEPSGRVVLFIAVGLCVFGFIWIRKIMNVDI